VNPFEHGGGAEYQISLLIDALTAAGNYEIHYLAHFLDGRDRSRSYQVSRIGSGAAVPRLGYLMDARSLYATLAAIDPAVIYQRVACAYTGVCAAYSRSRSVPMIWHVAHDTDVTPQSLDRSRNILRVRLEKWAVRYGARRATQIVVQTEDQSELLKRYYGRPPAAVIPNFHGPATETIDKSGPLTVVWIANLKPWKRPEVFVRVAASFRDRADVRFVMVGASGANAAASEWQKSLARDIDSLPNLQYLGERSHGQVNDLLARAHIFVNTSIHEGFPNTFIQSWQRDVVVVSLDVDPDRVLERRQVGVAAHTETALIAAVRELLDSPELRAAYAARGRAHASAHHSLRNASELVRLIDSSRS
jgi:glycosyltransferase involved in cell wall biosynthesis